MFHRAIAPSQPYLLALSLLLANELPADWFITRKISWCLTICQRSSSYVSTTKQTDEISDYWNGSLIRTPNDRAGAASGNDVSRAGYANCLYFHLVACYSFINRPAVVARNYTQLNIHPRYPNRPWNRKVDEVCHAMSLLVSFSI